MTDAGLWRWRQPLPAGSSPSLAGCHASRPPPATDWRTPGFVAGDCNRARAGETVSGDGSRVRVRGGWSLARLVS